MSLPLEDEIMGAIGLHSSYQWHNGSASCAGIRRQAARKLPGALRKHGLRPTPALMNAVEAVAMWGDESEDVLTKTWQACATAIRACIEDTQQSAANYIRANFARQVGGAAYLDKMGRMVKVDRGRR